MSSSVSPARSRGDRFKQIRKAFTLFVAAEQTGTTLSHQRIRQTTGWSEKTLNGYISKKYSKTFLTGTPATGYTVKGLVGVMTEDQFIAMHRQAYYKISVPLVSSPTPHVVKTAKRSLLALAVAFIALLWKQTRKGMK